MQLELKLRSIGQQLAGPGRKCPEIGARNIAGDETSLLVGPLFIDQDVVYHRHSAGQEHRRVQPDIRTSVSVVRILIIYDTAGGNSLGWDRDDITRRAQ